MQESSVVEGVHVLFHWQVKVLLSYVVPPEEKVPTGPHVYLKVFKLQLSTQKLVIVPNIDASGYCVNPFIINRK